MWRKRVPDILGMQIGYSYYENQYGNVSKNQELNYHMIKQIHFWIFIERNWNQNLKEKYLHSHVHWSFTSIS